MTRHLIWPWLLFWLLLAPLLSPSNPQATSPDQQLQPPQADFWLGTDLLGRDMLSRMLVGGQRTISLGFLATTCALSLGLLMGLAGRLHPLMDDALSIVLDALMTIPSLALAMFLLLLLGPTALTQAVAVGLAQTPAFARLVRGLLLSLSSADYVDAALALGASPLAILWRHLLPNAAPMLRAYSVAVFSYCLLNSAALSFLGFASPHTPDWGLMLAEGRSGFTLSPWPALWPALGLFVTVLLLQHWANQP